MALSGTFYGTTNNEYVRPKIVWSATQSVSGNYSTVKATLYYSRTNTGYTTYGTGTFKLTINGNSASVTKKIEITYNSNTVAVTHTVQVGHNSDGTKSITISATGGISGTSFTSTSISATVTLDTIPRATTPTLSASNVNMGASVTINMPRASSSFTHDLAYKLGSGGWLSGGSWVSIATGRGTSYAWTVPDLATSLPNATSGTVTIRCITKKGSTMIGTKTVSLTVKVPASVVPTLSSFTATEATAGIAAQFGAFVKSKSKLSIVVEAAGAKGSTPATCQLTFEGKSYMGKFSLVSSVYRATFTISELPKAGSRTIKLSITDSRNRTTNASRAITVLDYSPPQVSAFEVYRVNASGEATSDGEYIALRIKYSVTSLGGKNTASAVVKYKQSTASSFTNMATYTELSKDATVKPSAPVLSSDYQFDVQITVTDWFGGTGATKTAKLPSAAVILDIRANGKGFAVGKTSEKDGIEFGWDFADLVKSFGSLAGRYRTIEGLLIQWGVVSITPSAADTATTATVTFPLPYKSTPVTFASPVTSVPHTLSVSVQRAVVDDNKLGMAITLTRAGTTTTGVNWLAIGEGA